MHRLEVRMLVRLETGTVLLRTTTVHTFDRRGYAFARRAPARLVTKETLQSGNGPVIVYRHMKGQWYTCFQETT